MSDPFDLSGKVALVTGASQGLGRRFAQTLAAHGAVVGLAARQTAKLEDLRQAIEAAGGRAACVALDVTDTASIDPALALLEKTLGPLDVLVNNAGVAVSKGVLEQTEADWDKVVGTNLKGAFFTAQAAARRMAARGGGNIVNVASVLALDVVGHLAPYAASKGGLWQVTRTMALELARHNVRVNALAPGYIETEINRDFLATELRRPDEEKNPAAAFRHARGPRRRAAAARLRRLALYDGGDHRDRRRPDAGVAKDTGGRGMATARRLLPTATHWGAYRAEVEGGRVVAMHPIEQDQDPSPIGRSIPGTVDGPLRIREPMVREGWLERRHASDTARRGAEPFVAVGWDEALDLVAGEIRRIREQHGNQAIYAGSYGWASAGRFHHAQSQIHRFFNMAGGYTRSVNAYSHATAEVILPRVIGKLRPVLDGATDWSSIAAHGELFVSFGGIPLKNAQVNSGGVAAHRTRGWLERCRAAGVRFVYLGPLREDAADFLDAEWLQLRPNTDAAVMLGLAHTLVAEGLHDEAFLARYCTGFERFLPYLDGRERRAAEGCRPGRRAISGLDAEAIRALARRMAQSRTMVAVSWSLQRQDHGEQPYWMAVTLAAMLGQIGLPGGGFGCGYGAVHGIGVPCAKLKFASVAQGQSPINSYIPVARITELLERPGGTLDYDGKRLTLPDIQHDLLGRRQPVPPPPGPQPACCGPGGSPRPWSCTSRTGTRSRATPTSCCRRPRRSSATTSPRPRSIPSSSRCTRRSRRSARRATTTTFFSGWPSASVSPTPSPKAGARWRGCATSTTARARTRRARGWSCRRSTSSGSRA